MNNEGVVAIEKVDSLNLRDKIGEITPVVVLPGDHVFEAVWISSTKYDFYRGGLKTGTGRLRYDPKTFKIKCEAGKSYVIHARPGKSAVDMWIEDEATGAVLQKADPVPF